MGGGGGGGGVVIGSEWCLKGILMGFSGYTFLVCVCCEGGGGGGNYHTFCH